MTAMTPSPALASTLTPSYPHEPIFPAYIDSTMLVTGKSCKRKFYEEFVCRRAPVMRSPDLHGGGAVAAFFEHFRRAYYDDRLSKQDAILRATKAFMLFWGDFEPPERHVKTCANMYGACIDYLRNYDPEEDLCQPYRGADGKASVEFTFAVPLPIMHPVTGEPLLYCGRFDMLGEMGVQLWCVDEKTTKSFYQNWSDQWHMRTQFIGYTWGARQYDIPVEGAIVRGICIQQSQYRHQQAIVPYTRDKIERWYEVMIRDVEDLVTCWEEDFWPWDFAEACNAYGGCQFRAMCNSDKPENWHDDFKERVWNPLLKDPSKRLAPCEPQELAQ